LLVYARWFKECEALTENDYNTIVKIWKYRNEVAHELIKFLVKPWLPLLSLSIQPFVFRRK